MAVSNLSAPFKKSPLYSRDSFLRSPSWRWLQARTIVNALLMGTLLPLAEDTIVVFACRLQKAYRNPQTRKFIELKMPDAYQVMTLGTMDTSSQLRCLMEACLLSDLTPQLTSEKLKWCTALQVQLYKDLFFDLTGIKSVTAWILQMLLQPAHKGQSSNLFRARALAHYHSLDAALNGIRFGNLGRNAKLAMTNMWKDERSKQIFDYVAKSLNVPILIYITAMLQSIKSMLDKLMAQQLKGETNSGTALLLISKAMLTAVRGFTKALINLLTPLKKAGIDPSNLYITSIINKNKDVPSNG